VLDVLVARASGQPLGEFLRELIFESLGMRDTGFSLPADKLARFATSYTAGPASRAQVVYDEAVGGQWNQLSAFEVGGSGLVSTANDFLVFGQMLLNGGRLGKTRSLGRSSVELMTSDQLKPEQQASTGEFLGEGWGWASASPSSPAEMRGWPGNVVEFGPARGVGGAPDDAAGLGLARRAAVLAGFLDLGLPGDQ
jgi:CubicO group peptidase (beta-lactamase class C family)